MTPALIENVRARYESGYSAQRIANELRLRRSKVQRCINMFKKPKSTTPKAVIRRKDRMDDAIAELLADGCDPAIVAANFGG